MNSVVIGPSDVMLVSLDNKLVWKLRCPKCKQWGYLDDAQFYGRAGIACGNGKCNMGIVTDLSILVDSRLFNWKDKPNKEDSEEVSL